MLLCVCSVIDHRWRQNVVRTSGTRGDSRVCHWCSAARQHGTYFYFILTEIFAQNRSHEKLIRQFLHPIRIAKRLSHTWEKRFVQSEISCQNESISSQRAHVVVGVSSVFIHRSLLSFHKFTPVFSQISYKPQTVVESSNRSIALDKRSKRYI